MGFLVTSISISYKFIYFLVLFIFYLNMIYYYIKNIF